MVIFSVSSSPVVGAKLSSQKGRPSSMTGYPFNSLAGNNEKSDLTTGEKARTVQ